MTAVIKGHRFRSIPIQGDTIGVGPGAGILPQPPVYSECTQLSAADSVSALGRDPVTRQVAIGNGFNVDVFYQRGNSWFVRKTIVVGEAIVKVSMYGGRLWVATPTKTIYYSNLDALGNNIGGVGVIAGLLWSTNEDSNPDWVDEIVASYQTEPPSATRGPGVNFPRLFLLEATTTQVTIYDVGSGIPIMWMVFLSAGTAVGADRNMIGSNSQDITSIDYADGRLYVGSDNGLRGSDGVAFASDNSALVTASAEQVYNGNIAQRNDGLDFTIVNTNSIVNGIVNDIAATVLATVETTNLLSASEDLTDAYWTKTRVTVGGSDAAPGGIQAQKLIPTAVNNSHFVTAMDTGKTLSVFARADGYDFVKLTSDGPFESSVFDIANGTIVAIGGSHTPRLESLGGGWYRCSITKSVAFAPFIEVADDATGGAFIGDGVSGIFYGGMQLEDSVNIHAYVPSVTGPTTGDTPAASQLVNRTNLLRYSNDTSDALWKALGGASKLTGKTINDPEGAPYPYAFTANGTGLVRQDLTADWADETAYSFWLYVFDLGDATEVRTDIKDGVQGVQSIDSSYVGRWTRVFLPPASIGAAGSDFIDISFTNAGAAVEFALWGLQLESGEQETALIKTEASPATVTDNTGLKIPTWHVETATDVSVGVDTGAINDITGLTGTDFGGWIGDEMFFTDTTGNVVYRGPVPVADIAVGTWNTASYDAVITTSPYFQGVTVQATAGGDSLSIGTDGGLTRIDDPAFSIADTNSNTGYMVDPDGAWANDTDTAVLGKPWDLYEDFNAPDDRVFTDTFDRTDLAPWVDSSPVSWEIVNNALQSVVASVFVYYFDDQIYKAGSWYAVTGQISDGSCFCGAWDQAPTTGELSGTAQTRTGDFTFYFQTTNARASVAFSSNQTGARLSNVLIQEVLALDGAVDVSDASSTGTIEVVNQALEITGDGAFTTAVEYTIATTAAANYVFTSDVAISAAGYRINGTPGTLNLGQNSIPFVGVGASTVIEVNKTAAAMTSIDNLTVQEDPAGTDSLTDNSGQGNNATVIGQGIRVPFNAPCGDLQGVACGLGDGIAMSGSASSVLRGYQSSDGGATWLYRQGNWYNARYDSGAGQWVVSGESDLDMAYAQLTLNGS